MRCWRGDLPATCAGSQLQIVVLIEACPLLISGPYLIFGASMTLIVSVTCAGRACTALRDLVIVSMCGFEQQGMTLFQVRQWLNLITGHRRGSCAFGPCTTLLPCIPIVRLLHDHCLHVEAGTGTRALCPNTCAYPST